MLALIATTAWPAVSWRSLACRMLIEAPPAALLVLAVTMQQQLIDALAPGEASVLIAWSAFMRGGARYALALAAAAVGLCAGRARAAS